jgi:exonuclease-1
MNGMFESIKLQDALQHLSMTEDEFQNMCIVAGCDYLPNIRCVGIATAKKIVLKETDLISALLKVKNVPEGYSCSFVQAKAIFNHQTVIDIATLRTIPLKQWEAAEKTDTLQNLCGKYP